jgi:hypothetical protein
MVDFPEGYGFAPGEGRSVMQETFSVDIGTFDRREPKVYVKTKRRMAPYTFTAIGCVGKGGPDQPIRGTLYKWGGVSAPPIEGTLQQVVTAICTIHRMTGEAK